MFKLRHGFIAATLAALVPSAIASESNEEQRADVDRYVSTRMNCAVMKTKVGRKDCKAAVDDYRDCRRRAFDLKQDHTCFTQAIEYDRVAKEDGAASLPSPKIGMSAQFVAERTNWGSPQAINRTESATGVTEQWVYGSGNYLYFKNGRLRAIQDRR